MANILIADDSKFMRRILSDILNEEGHQIVGEAENAKETIELYKKLKPDLVTLDIIMPEVEEVDAISSLKEMLNVNPRARVVIVSAMGQEAVVEECIQAGARGFIVKPFKPENIKDVVKGALYE